MPNHDFKRCFIAINIPPEIQKSLTEAINNLKLLNSGQLIRYINAGKIHLTLHFLGNLDLKKIEEVKKIISETAKKYNGYILTAKEIKAFPNTLNPRVIYVETADEQNISGEIQKNLGANLYKLGITVDKRTWHPHLTIARIKGLTGSELKLPPLISKKFTVSSIELMESHLTSKGADYSIISTSKLSKYGQN